MRRWQIATLTIFGVLALDQILKIWIKTNLAYKESMMDLGFFRLYFIENNGMAFGTEFGGDWGKLLLSLFRVFAIFIIGYYLYKFIKSGAHKGLIASIALIFAGAFGNIIDSIVYGKIFDRSCPCNSNSGPECIWENTYCAGDGVAEIVSPSSGYADVFYGRVVDMLQFTVSWPEWMPFVGGSEVFPFIFNIADAAITIGVLIVLIWSKTFFGGEEIKDWNPLNWFKTKSTHNENN